MRTNPDHFYPSIASPYSKENFQLSREIISISANFVLRQTPPQTEDYYRYFQQVWQEEMYQTALYVLCKSIQSDPNLAHVKEDIVNLCEPFHLYAYEQDPHYRETYQKLYIKIIDLLERPSPSDLILIAEHQLLREKRLCRALKTTLNTLAMIPLTEELLTLAQQIKVIFNDIDSKGIVADTVRKTRETRENIARIKELLAPIPKNPLFIFPSSH